MRSGFAGEGDFEETTGGGRSFKGSGPRLQVQVRYVHFWSKLYCAKLYRANQSVVVLEDFWGWDNRIAGRKYLCT